MPSRGHQRGLSLLEFTLAVLIVSVLTVLAFERVAAMQASMERAQVRHTVGAMRAALALEFAHRAVRGELDEVRDHAGTNALALLSPPPPGYVGARDGPIAADVAPGRWYYARAPGLVAYRPRYPEIFGGPEGARLYWRATPQWRDMEDARRHDAAREIAQGLALERALPDGRVP